MPIRVGTYNIWNGINGGVDSELRGVSQANMDLGIFQETKLSDGVYTRGSTGYSVIAVDAPIRHRGGVAVLYRTALHFVVEAVQKFGPNAVGFQLATGERRWYIVGCYLAPDDALTIISVVAALKERPWGAKLLVAGDFNTNLLEPKGSGRGEEIAATLVTGGLEDMLVHFLPRRRSRCRDRRMWSMIQTGREARFRTDCCIFWNVSVRDPRHKSDHYMVLGCLCRAPLREHYKCLGGSNRLPLRPPTTPTR